VPPTDQRITEPRGCKSLSALMPAARPSSATMEPLRRIRRFSSSAGPFGHPALARHRRVRCRRPLASAAYYFDRALARASGAKLSCFANGPELPVWAFASVLLTLVAIGARIWLRLPPLLWVRQHRAAASVWLYWLVFFLLLTRRTTIVTMRISKTIAPVKKCDAPTHFGNARRNCKESQD
jgi:hypothetical protein